MAHLNWIDHFRLFYSGIVEKFQYLSHIICVFFLLRLQQVEAHSARRRERLGLLSPVAVCGTALGCIPIAADLVLDLPVFSPPGFIEMHHFQALISVSFVL